MISASARSPDKVAPAVTDSVPARTWCRFFGQTLLVAAVCLALLWWWSARFDGFDYLSGEFAMNAAKKALSGNLPKDSIVLLGDSRVMMGADPRQIDPRAVNLGSPGGTPIEIDFLVGRALASPTPPRAAIISLSFAQFAHDSEFWDFTVPTGFLNSAQVAEVYRDAALQHDPEILGAHLWGRAANWAREYLLPRRFPLFYAGSIQRSHFGQRGPVNRQIYADLLANRGGFATVSTVMAAGEERDVTMSEFRIAPTNARYLDHTLQSLAGRHIPVYFVSAPRQEEIQRHYAPAVLAGYRDFLARICEKYPDAHVLGPLCPTLPSGLFADPMHLNASGARHWSESLRLLLQETDARKSVVNSSALHARSSLVAHFLRIGTPALPLCRPSRAPRPGQSWSRWPKPTSTSPRPPGSIAL